MVSPNASWCADCGVAINIAHTSPYYFQNSESDMLDYAETEYEADSSFNTIYTDESNEAYAYHIHSERLAVSGPSLEEPEHAQELKPTARSGTWRREAATTAQSKATLPCLVTFVNTASCQIHQV
jgi:hypothetical protein